MKKVAHINLGGQPFTIDDDAYEALSQYMEAIHRQFRKSEGYEEITHDIEVRMAELFLQRMGGRVIIDRNDVEVIVGIMGRPSEFSEDTTPESDHYYEEPREETTTEGGNRWGSGIKTGKRLYRDTENKVVSGVCSGLSAYFGIQDPVWLRLAFAVGVVSGGFGIVLYIILWAIIPAAKTAADRLAMRGEPIDIHSIAKDIEEGVQSFSEKFNKTFDKKDKGKWKQKWHEKQNKFHHKWDKHKEEWERRYGSSEPQSRQDDDRVLWADNSRSGKQSSYDDSLFLYQDTHALQAIIPQAMDWALLARFAMIAFFFCLSMLTLIKIGQWWAGVPVSSQDWDALTAAFNWNW
jgi:phage shock protein PspC (stress-responsive transcriptional regulator)